MDYIAQRRERIAARWNLTDEIILISSGSEIIIPGRGDQTYPFRSHSEFFYLTDREVPNAVLAYDPKEGWTGFYPRLTPEQAMWMAPIPEEGRDAKELTDWLEKRKGRRIANLGSPNSAVTSDENLEKELREALSQVRRPKDEEEIDRMRKAAAASTKAYAAIDGLISPGKSEREIQVELEYHFFKNGGDRTAYDTIVGSGPNSAMLHFTPTHRTLQMGELVLIDAGAEHKGYASDVTRTYPTTTFTSEQRDIYSIVLEANKNGIARCKAGVEYRDIHLHASLDLAQGLIDLGLLKGNPQSLVEQGSHALFFPHGIGHLVGLGVRDAGGYLPGRLPSDQFGSRFLRIDLPLQPNYTVTIEPGIYFIPVILQNKEFREQHRDTVNWDKADSMLNFGGIRIEDNVRITEGEPEVLTAGIAK
jgi:Xaa-Pro aminopeptidase